MGHELGAGFAGAGQALAFLAHHLLAELLGKPSIPVQLTDVETAGGMRGREVVCLDLSEYGDPLNTRIVRIPFSAPLDALPPCARRILVQPNDSLLKPAGIRHVVRTLLALGWHPRHVAGLVRSKYERDFGWGHTFYRYDAAARADFYTRLFAGLVAVGLDTLDDFHCEELKAIGFCTQADCNESLTRYRTSLAERKHHERLAGRPVHGLFLPNEHSLTAWRRSATAVSG